MDEEKGREIIVAGHDNVNDSDVRPDEERLRRNIAVIGCGNIPIAAAMMGKTIMSPVVMDRLLTNHNLYLDTFEYHLTQQRADYLDSLYMPVPKRFRDAVVSPVRDSSVNPKKMRNQKCSCGSGLKFKNCCMRNKKKDVETD